MKINRANPPDKMDKVRIKWEEKLSAHRNRQKLTNTKIRKIRKMLRWRRKKHGLNEKPRMFRLE
jgi:hypothetical protein